MIGQWAQARAVHYALTADKDLPPGSKEESEAKPNWSKMAEYKQSLIELKHEFSQALASPRHFGAFLGMPTVLGEPPPETLKTLQDIKREEAERNRRLPEEARQFFLNDSVLARAAKQGGTFKPAT